MTFTGTFVNGEMPDVTIRRLRRFHRLGGLFSHLRHLWNLRIVRPFG